MSRSDDIYKQLQDYQQKYNPGQYQSQYQGQIDALMKELGNRDFDYNYQTDPTYQAYKRQYERNAARAAENAQANAAATSGGYGSSWATTAAEDAYAQTMSGLDNVANNLYGQALDTYTDETNDKYGILNNLMQAESQAQQKHAQAVQDYNSQVSYLNQQYEAQKNREQQNTNTWLTVGGGLLGGFIKLLPYLLPLL